MRVPGELIPIVLFIMVGVVAIGAPIAKAIARKIERSGNEGWGGLPNDVSARLERMEQAIDSIAVEVERISEGQRFTSKLLSERADVGRPDSALVRHND